MVLDAVGSGKSCAIYEGDPSAMQGGGGGGAVPFGPGGGGSEKSDSVGGFETPPLC